MHVSDILSKRQNPPVTIDADCTIHEAITLLNAERIGALMVTDQAAEVKSGHSDSGHRHVRYSRGGTTATTVESSEICGIVTERDVLRTCGKHCGHLGGALTHQDTTCTALVRDAMTKDEDLIIALPGDDLDYVMRVMTRKGVKHLPVLDEGKLAGVIAMADVAKVQVEDSQFELRMLRDYVHGTY